MTDAELSAYHELSAYTLGHGSAAFIHQHVVDAFAAQHADDRSKPIGVTFALVGLFLHVEKQWTGRQVQRAHMKLASEKHPWPAFALPAQRGAMTAADVMAAAEGPERDKAIDAWCASVWNAFADQRQAVERLLTQHHIL